MQATRRDLQIVLWAFLAALLLGPAWAHKVTVGSFPVAVYAGDSTQPAISDGVVVFTEEDGYGGTDIWGYSLPSQVEFPVCTAAGSQRDPAIAGGLAVWVDGRSPSGALALYRYRFSQSQESPIAWALQGTMAHPSI